MAEVFLAWHRHLSFQNSAHRDQHKAH